MWNAVYKKLWIVSLVPLVAGAIAWFLTFQGASDYRSTALIKADLPVVTQAQGVKDLTEPDEYYENLVETMKTEVITSMASYRLLLHDMESQNGFRTPAIQYSASRKDLYKKKLESKLAKFELLSENDATEQTIFRVLTNTDYNISRWIRDGEIDIHRVPGSNEVAVSVSTEDPFLSAFAANALSQEFIRFENSGSIIPAAQTTVVSKDSLSYYRAETQRLKSVVDETTAELVTAGSQPATARKQISNKEKEDRIAEYKMRIVEEEWEINNLKDQLRRSENERKTVSTENGSADVTANSKIQAVRKRIDQLSKMYVEGGRKDKQLDSVITRLRAQVNDATARLQASAKTPATVTIQDPNRQMIESRIKRHEEALVKIQADMRRVKNAGGTAVVANNTNGIQKTLDRVTADYNSMLLKLKAAEATVVPSGTAATANLLVLKTKALPSAKPESPWAAWIILGTVSFTMLLCIVIIGLTRPTAPKFDERFLHVNYSNQRMPRTVEKRA